MKAFTETVLLYLHFHTVYIPNLDRCLLTQTAPNLSNVTKLPNFFNLKNFNHHFLDMAGFVYFSLIQVRPLAANIVCHIRETN